MSSVLITIVQTALYWENKEANRQMLEQKIRAINGKTEIVVLPEMFSTGFSMNPSALAETMDGETVQWMKKIAAEKKIILTGSIIIKEKAPSPKERAGVRRRVSDSDHGVGGEVYFNRLIWMLPNGKYGYYDKRHRFAFAGEDQHYTAGNKRLITSVNGWKINLQVCYDLRFPVWARQTSPDKGEGEISAPEYDLLIYVANWPERRNTAWKTLLQARAIENQSYVVGVNRVGADGNGINHSGDSLVIDPLGEILYHKKNEEDIFTIALDKEHLQNIREKFPFWKDGDAFQILPNNE